MDKVKVGVVSFSGGQDSTTVLTYAKKLGYELYALSFLYGQVLSREVEQAKKICEILKIKHEVFDISTFKDLAWFSALTNSEKLSIPVYERHEELGDEIPFTYVPFRNSFFLICCAAYLESLLLRKIEIEGSSDSIEACIFIAANSIDYSNYPDCRPEYFRKAEEFLNLGSKLGTFYKVRIKIETPIIEMSKKEITELGVKLNAPLHMTQTCYTGEPKACGKCPSCLLRIQGFKEAGYIDPIEYAIPVDWSGCRKIDEK